MKIGKILAVAAVATVFASCSNEEELANVSKSESNACRNIRIVRHPYHADWHNQPYDYGL